MKRILFFLFIAKISAVAAQSVGIGTTNPNNCALLDVQSTNKGVLVLGMTSS